MLLLQRGLSLLKVRRSAIQLAMTLLQLSRSCRRLPAGRGELTLTLGQRVLLLLDGGPLLGDLLTGRLDLPEPLGQSRELVVMTTVQTAEPFDLLLNAREDVENLVARGLRDFIQRLSVGSGQWRRRASTGPGRVRVPTRGLIVVVVMLHSRALALVTAPRASRDRVDIVNAADSLQRVVRISLMNHKFRSKGSDSAVFLI